MKITVKKEGSKNPLYYSLDFVDRFRFMSTFLLNLKENLSGKILQNKRKIKKYSCKSFREYEKLDKNFLNLKTRKIYY